LVKGLAALALSDEHEPVNIGNPSEFTILEFAKLIQKLVGSDCPIETRPLPRDDPKQRRPDISRAKRVLGWEPTTPLEKGLRATIDYFRRGEVAAA
jgi:dTDP-glucose 4,6-dehydratase